MTYRNQIAEVFVSKVALVILSFVSVVIYAKLIPADELGVYFLFIALVRVLTLVADLGIEKSLEKRLSEESRNSREIIGASIVLKAIFLVFVTAILIIYNNTINNYIGADLTYLMVLLLVVEQTHGLLKSILRGKLEVSAAEKVKVITQTTAHISSVAFVIGGVGISGIIYGAVIGHMLGLLYIPTKFSITPGTPAMSNFRSLMDFSKYEVINQFGGKIYEWIDVLLIGFFLTSTTVAGYELAWKVMGVTSVIGSTFSTTLFPHASRWFQNGDYDRINVALDQALNIGLLIAVPAFIGAAFLSRDILSILFSNEYIFASFALSVLMFGQIFQTLHIPISRCLQGVNKANISAVITIVSVAVNLFLNIVLIQLFNIVGAAIATTITILLNLLLHLYYLKKHINYTPNFSLIYPCATASVSMFISLVLTTSVYSITSTPRLFLVIFTNMSVYFIVLLLFEEPKDIIYKIIDILTSNN